MAVISGTAATCTDSRSKEGLDIRVAACGLCTLRDWAWGVTQLLFALTIALSAHFDGTMVVREGDHYVLRSGRITENIDDSLGRLFYVVSRGLVVAAAVAIIAHGTVILGGRGDSSPIANADTDSDGTSVALWMGRSAVVASLGYAVLRLLRLVE